MSVKLLDTPCIIFLVLSRFLQAFVKFLVARHRPVQRLVALLDIPGGVVNLSCREASAEFVKVRPG